mmetsp:Transcript_39160/g.44659  ORF Transcript_39160/g.44659 Transcript_39160/m.44659 type:complete len:266 (+) Transcript_39160:1485-2282(+)
MYLDKYITVDEDVDIPRGINEHVTVLRAKALDYKHNLFVINDVQLYLLNDQILSKKATNDLINNKHKTWLYHEQTLQGEFDRLEVLSPLDLTGATMRGMYPKPFPNGWEHKWTYKDSVFQNYVATNAIDGNLSTYAHSGFSQEIVDLNHGHDNGADFNAHLDITFPKAEISMIEVFNRPDWRESIVLQARWDTLFAAIYDGDKVVWRENLGEREYTSPRNRDGKETFKFETPLTGNRVRIGLWLPGFSGRDFLQVAEAIVYGSTL